MISLSFHPAANSRVVVKTQQPPSARPLRNRWSHGRGVIVIVALSPLVLGSLLGLICHDWLTRRLGSLPLRWR